MTAEHIYNQLSSIREQYITRARESASYTIPYVVPLADYVNGPTNEAYDQPWSGIGARGVNNLSSRLMLAVLPATEAFYRFTIDEAERAAQRRIVEQQLTDEGLSPEEVAAEVARQETEYDLALSNLEQAVLREIEATNDRVAVFQSLIQLLIVGNVIMHLGEEGLRYHPLQRYVLRRHPHGPPAEAVICEMVSEASLPEEARALLTREISPGDEAAPSLDNRHKVFTHVKWGEDRVEWHQEINGKEIEGTSDSARRDESPWIPLRMYAIDGQDYSPGYVESKCLADLHTANALTQALMEGALVAARTVFGRKPGALVRNKQFAEAKNGDVLTMNEGDVFPVQANKQNDLATAQQALAQVTASLSASFMLSSVRDSERTTAEEVRLQALEIENSLGAVYAILTSEMQAPFISCKLAQLTKKKRIPSMPEGLVRPVVSVGLAAVGRNNDLEKVARFMQLGQQFGGPEFMARVNQEVLYKELASKIGMTAAGLIKSEGQVQQEMAAAQQAAQQAEMAKQAMTAPAADPQRLASAAQTLQEMGGQPPPDATTQPMETPA
jgi:hypothetical protein